MSARNTNIRTDSITPTFRGQYLERFLKLVEAIDGIDAQSQRTAVQGELGWCTKQTNGEIDRIKYRAALMVLSDVMGQGWKTQFRQRRIFLTRPDYTHDKHLGLDHKLVKNQIREAFQDERIARIAAPSTARFIRNLESPQKGKQSVLSLVRSGPELAKGLMSLPQHPTPEDLRKVVDPYLQLVTADKRDDASGLRLLDVWRYFRYLWAIPYQSTPGRNLFYLVRDRARPEHPVIGIAALGNCVVQLSDRDQLIGWSVDAIEKALHRRHRFITRDLPKTSNVRKAREIQYLESEQGYQARITEYAARLEKVIDSALTAEVDLLSRKGLVTAAECAKPTDAIIRRLLAIASESESARRHELKAAHEKGEAIRRPGKSSIVKNDSKSNLYVRKRAQALADILVARLTFRRERFKESPLEAVRHMLQTSDGRKALRIGLHSNKKTKIGSSMMDIIVCGAIPPYGELLGGKLVAMLMGSPQVAKEYRAAYCDQPGEIVSRLAGKKVVRPAELVFLTTTSLYHVGSSQYERIRVPGLVEGQVSFEHIGMTEGYGSTALSSDTVALLRDVIIKSEGMQRINSIFGEGISPKMRLVRDGLALIGIPEDLVLRHDCPRLIYGVRLAKNSFEYLRGESDVPDYIFPPDRSAEGTEMIVRYWLERWFRGRSKREESIQKVGHFDPVSIALSNVLNAIQDDAVEEAPDVGFG